MEALLRCCLKGVGASKAGAGSPAGPDPHSQCFFRTICFHQMGGLMPMCIFQRALHLWIEVSRAGSYTSDGFAPCVPIPFKSGASKHLAHGPLQLLKLSHWPGKGRAFISNVWQQGGRSQLSDQWSTGHIRGSCRPELTRRP